MRMSHGCQNNIVCVFQYLPTAQRLLDQLRDPYSKINTEEGAPDPTDGGHEEVAAWFLDERTLHDNIRKILVKFCVPSPTVFRLAIHSQFNPICRVDCTSCFLS